MRETNEGFAYVDGGVTAPAGFLVAAVSAGLKKSGKRDLAIIACERAVPSAGVFTLNAVAAAPVRVSRAAIADGTLRAAVVNAGNANACTGPQGEADARAMAEAVAEGLSCAAGDIAVCSTGVIGVPMPMALVNAGIAEAVGALDCVSGDAAAEAIMTTDTYAKQTAVALDVNGTRITVGGMAKGSGMIQPNMATMLAFVTTDAPLTPAACDAALRRAVDATFNRITVDSDTSTNDTCLLMASGAARGPSIDVADEAFGAVTEAVLHVCRELAQMVVKDGEGATKSIEVSVTGASNDADATAVAFSIANSPLFKTAIFGGDANWGRVAMAVGKAGVSIDPAYLSITFAGIPTCSNGMPVSFDEDEAARALAADHIEVDVDLGIGTGAANVWTCDLSYEYVRINGDYRS